MLVEKRPHASTTQSAAPTAGFRSLLEHLATLTRNQVRFAGATADVPMLTEPASAQREAFDLLGVPIPCQRRPGPAQVPGEAAGEHADQHARPDAFLQADL